MNPMQQNKIVVAKFSWEIQDWIFRTVDDFKMGKACQGATSTRNSTFSGICHSGLPNGQLIYLFIVRLTHWKLSTLFHEPDVPVATFCHNVYHAVLSLATSLNENLRFCFLFSVLLCFEFWAWVWTTICEHPFWVLANWSFAKLDWADKALNINYSLNTYNSGV